MLAPPEEIRKMWCSLVRFGVYFDQSTCVLKKSLKISNFFYETYFYIKNNYFIHVGTRLLWGILI